MSEINMTSAACRISSREYQFPRQFERMLASAFEHERSGVSQYRRVKAGRDLRGNLDSCFSRHPIDHFGRGHRLRINPIHMRKGAAALVMIDVDQELFFESL